jgi:hypothetical protein
VSSSSKKTRIALLDGDIILYQSAFMRKKSPKSAIELKEGFSSKGVNAEKNEERTWEECKKDVDSLIEEILQNSGCSEYIAWLSASSKGNFRHAIAKSKGYKSSRKDKEIPKYFNDIKKYLIEEYGFRKLTKIETDDALVILQKHFREIEDHVSIICTKDKDLKQVAGWNYNWQTNEMVNITEEQGWRLLCKQVLTGDSGDDIVGCGEIKPVYMGTKKLIESGAFPVDKNDEKCFPTKVSRDKHIKQLQKDALTDKKLASMLKEKFDLVPELRRVGVGPKDAEAILDHADKHELLSYQGVIMDKFMEMFGVRRGVDKYFESWSLIMMVPDFNYAAELGEDMSLLTPVYSKPEVEEDYDDEF